MTKKFDSRFPLSWDNSLSSAVAEAACDNGISTAEFIRRVLAKNKEVIAKMKELKDE